MSEAAQPKGEEGMGIPPENTATVQPIPALAYEGNILEKFARDLKVVCGVVGEERIAKLLYLAITSRFLDRPVSIVVKGPSSGGKSFTVEQVLRFFPASAYYVLTSMSEKALAYIDEDLRHRIIVIYEAAGMAGKTASYLMRTLLSEGQINHQTVELTKEGLRPRRIQVEGPVGLLVTTTAVNLHPENETRLLSVTVTDTPEQTRKVFQALAGKNDRTVDHPDLGQWQALQEWSPNHEVVIPYAHQLAELVSNEAPRLRRDFSTLLSLIKSHAILHQASRECDEAGRVVATVEDYAVVRELLAELMAEGVEAAVPAIVRETVSAVAALQVDDAQREVTGIEVAQHLGLDKASASRRVRVAIKAGYLGNREWRKGQPQRLYLADPMPEDREVLPTVERLRGCAENGGVYPPHADADVASASDIWELAP
jgi:hypothetical protein